MKRMEKKKRRVLIWSTLGILVVLLFLAPHPKKIGVEDTPGTQKGDGQPAIQMVTSTLSGSNPPYKIDIQYPRLAGLTDKAVSDKVNADIKATVDASVANFKANLNPPIPDLKDAKNSLTILYDNVYLSKYIFSVAIESGSYVIGSAHDSNFVDTLNYDLRTGKRVDLADLFTKGSDYINVISDYAITDIAKQLDVKPEDKEAMDWIKTGAGPKADNFHNFLIGKEGLVMIFDTYQVAPGAAGMPKVAVPYALLQKDVDAGGLLAVRFAN